MYLVGVPRYSGASFRGVRRFRLGKTLIEIGKCYSFLFLRLRSWRSG